VPTSPELTRRERKKKITRETLLAVALEIISRQGLYVTTIEDVTEKADLGKGTFYQYFSSKEELLEKLLEEGLDKLLASCRIALHGAKTSNAILRTLVRIHIDFLTLHTDYLLLFHQVRGFLLLKEPVSVNLKKIYSRYLSDLAQLFSVSGAAPSDKSREMAMSLAAYSAGLAAHYRLFHRTLDLPFDKSTLERRILEALL
jgi:AcrR family transcriptional regulator